MFRAPRENIVAKLLCLVNAMLGCGVIHVIAGVVGDVSLATQRIQHRDSP